MQPTPQLKKAYYVFKLYFPSLQFIVLVILLAMVAACSPLSPSADRHSLSATPIKATDVSQHISDAVQQDFITASLTEVATVDTKKIYEKDFDRKIQGSLLLDTPDLNSQLIDSAIQKRSSDGVQMAFSSSAFLTIRLPRDKLDNLFRDGQVRVDLYSLLKDADNSKAKPLFQELQRELKNRSLRASSYLLVSSGNTENTGFKVKISLALNELAILELKQQEGSNASVLEAAIRDAKQMAIVLE